MDDESGVVPSTTNQENGDVTTTDSASADQSAHQPKTDANPSEQPSSSKSDAKTQTPESLADVVERALKGETGESSPSEQPEGKNPKAEETDLEKDGVKKPDAQSEGEDDVPKEFHKHPAWKRLQTQRDEARAQVEQYRSDSQEFRAITGFMQENNIAADEVAETMQWLALRNSNPGKFADAILNLADDIRKDMGLTLPPELQERIDAGEISEKDAKELVKSKAEAKLYKEQSERRREAETRNQNTDRVKQLTSQMADTVNAWERQIQTTDLDYGRKRQLVNRTIRSYIQEFGMPQSPEQALKYAKTAHQEVTKHLNGIIPPKKENIPQTPGGKQVETAFQPKSLEDVVSHVLAGGG